MVNYCHTSLNPNHLHNNKTKNRSIIIKIYSIFPNPNNQTIYIHNNKIFIILILPTNKKILSLNNTKIFIMLSKIVIINCKLKTNNLKLLHKLLLTNKMPFNLI